MTDEQQRGQAGDAGAASTPEEDALEVILEDESPVGDAAEATAVLATAGDQVTEILTARPEPVADTLAARPEQATEVIGLSSGEEEAPAPEPELVVELDDMDLSAGTELPDDALVVDLEPEAPALPSLARKPVDLDLSAMDLESEPAPAAAKTPAWGEPVGGNLPGKEAPSGKSAGPATAAFSFSGVLIMAIAGLLGGLLGWALTEPLQSALEGSTLSLVAQTALYAAFVGGAIGLALGAGNGFAVGVAAKGVRWAAFGLLWGALGGAVGGGLAQKMYGDLSVEYAFAWWADLLMHAAGWSIMGVFFGLGQSAVVTADKKMRNGILGGALGGLLGGAVFQLLNVSDHGSSGRCLALCAMGLCIGTLIGLIDEAAKEAWVRVTGGPLTGKQFILYEERTVIGSTPTCSITLIKDPNVAPEHAEIRNERTEFVIASLLPGAVVLVNGRPITRRVLEDGDDIAIGQTRMEFRERKQDEERKGRKAMEERVK